MGGAAGVEPTLTAWLLEQDLCLPFLRDTHRQPGQPGRQDARTPASRVRVQAGTRTHCYLISPTATSKQPEKATALRSEARGRKRRRSPSGCSGQQRDQPSGARQDRQQRAQPAAPGRDKHLWRHPCRGGRFGAGLRWAGRLETWDSRAEGVVRGRVRSRWRGSRPAGPSRRRLQALRGTPELDARGLLRGSAAGG